MKIYFQLGPEETENLLEQRSASEDDDFFLNGPPSRHTAVQFEDDRLNHVRGQIAEVTDTMRSNVNKILERGDRLEDLQDASERLNTASVDFQSAANRMRRRAWIQHMKTRAILGGIVALVLICLIVPIIVYYTSSEKTV